MLQYLHNLETVDTICRGRCWMDEPATTEGDSLGPWFMSGPEITDAVSSPCNEDTPANIRLLLIDVPIGNVEAGSP